MGEPNVQIKLAPNGLLSSHRFSLPINRAIPQAIEFTNLLASSNILISFIILINFYLLRKV
ncbi:MAG TPA: hypothetical protein PLP72_26140, partial [Leptospiraceae bacterium]|nr:hypothetical protein [Leptospiraceae bacterium]